MKGLLLFVALAVTIVGIYASSHGEAPATSAMPTTDSTDLYAFQSYESGRSGFTTIIANYNPRQAPFGGPNYYALDSNFYYNIHIDWTGKGIPSLTFQFQIINEISNGGFGLSYEVENAEPRLIPIALKTGGPVVASNGYADLNYLEYYRINMINGFTSTSTPITRLENGRDYFAKPFDNAGTKTFPPGSSSYANYSANFVYNINIPGCSTPGRVFVGQRNDPFAINVGKLFDLVNIVPIQSGFSKALGGISQNNANNVFRWLSIEAFTLELPTSCIIGPKSSVIGIWTTTNSVFGGKQRSRLGNPLVNELFIGLPDKDRWSGRTPNQDGLLNQYIQYPTFPSILSSLFLNYINTQTKSKLSTLAPNNYPRNDLVAIFLTGIPGINVLQSRPGHLIEMLRLNTSIPAVPASSQNNLGVIGLDFAGFPNGRRPGEDIIDIALRAVMGVICANKNFAKLKVCSASNAPVGNVPFTDGAPVNAGFFPSAFPYLNTPVPGSLNIN